VAGDDGRSEAPTQRRLQTAREEGQVAISREALTFGILAAVTLLFTFQGGAMTRDFAARLAVVLEAADRLPPLAALAACATAAFRLVAPVAGLVVAVAVALTLGQTRFLLHPTALLPSFGRLDPRPRLNRLFGPTALVEAARALAKLAVVATGAGIALAAVVPGFPAALSWTVPWLGGQIADVLLHIARVVLTAFAFVVAADIAGGQWQHLQRLRMSRADIRDEHKDIEGNPLIKRRIRQLQQQRARRRMMAAVPTATVVLTNPTHYAVALAYDRSRRGAPRVVAKGVDEVAARIRSVAEQNRVPVVANPPLARALHKVDLGAEIPAEHYRVVAEIIAYVWRLRGRLAARPAVS
jgi:flagellar biosynthetic protein FlhB